MRIPELLSRRRVRIVVEQRDHLRTGPLEQSRRRRQLAESREGVVDLEVRADVPHRSDAERRVLSDLDLHVPPSRIAWNELV